MKSRRFALHRFLAVSLCVGLLAGCSSRVATSTARVPEARDPKVVALSPRDSSDPQIASALVGSQSVRAPSFPLEARRDQRARTDLGTAERTGSDIDTRVPDFDLVDYTGDTIHSDELVGKQAFAVVFFASWCELCARKLKMVRDTFAETDDVRLVLVSVDGPDTVHHVPGFLREQRLEQEQVIDGLSHPSFTHGYNPVSSIPLVAIVGKSGNLVDYQIGLQTGDAPRLRTALLRATE